MSCIKIRLETGNLVRSWSELKLLRFSITQSDSQFIYKTISPCTGSNYQNFCVVTYRPKRL